MVKERLGVHVHLQSFIECYFNKLASGLEKATKKSNLYNKIIAITPKMCVDIGL